MICDLVPHGSDKGISTDEIHSRIKADLKPRSDDRSPVSDERRRWGSVWITTVCTRRPIFTKTGSQCRVALKSAVSVRLPENDMKVIPGMQGMLAW